MIVLHRLGHQADTFRVNPDLILTVEATPDTVITLTTGVKIVVAEPPERVSERMREWRVEILMEAMRRRHDERSAAAPAAARRASRAELTVLEEAQELG